MSSNGVCLGHMGHMRGNRNSHKWGPVAVTCDSNIDGVCDFSDAPDGDASAATGTLTRTTIGLDGTDAARAAATRDCSGARSDMRLLPDPTKTPPSAASAAHTADRAKGDGRSKLPGVGRTASPVPS